MCDFDKGFILCTCEHEETSIVHHKKSKRLQKKRTKENPTKQQYNWFLSEFVESYIPIMEGLYESPAHDIGQGLSEEWVLLNLQEGNCFDFEYTPKEGDNLVLRPTNTKLPNYKFLSFIYTNGAWQIGQHDVFSTTLKLKTKGQIKPTIDKQSF